MLECPKEREIKQWLDGRVAQRKGDLARPAAA
jgi:hypothetical protein